MSAARPSARKSLRDRLDEARAADFIDLRVTTPAFEGLHVRCRAFTSAELTQSLEQHGKKANPAVAMAVDALVSTCIGIWEEADGKGVSPVDGFAGVVDLATMVQAGPLPTFSSPELADALGLSDPTAEGIVRALLAPTAELRLLSYADALEAFSTGSNESVVRAARGN